MLGTQPALSLISYFVSFLLLGLIREDYSRSAAQRALTVCRYVTLERGPGEKLSSPLIGVRASKLVIIFFISFDKLWMRRMKRGCLQPGKKVKTLRDGQS
jgi:hypothetical protein